MAVDFILQIIEKNNTLKNKNAHPTADGHPYFIRRGYNMSTMIETKPAAKWILTAQDRCDRCSAEALVRVTGLSGELMFCGHHYNSVMDNAVGYDKMMKFAITILDERDKLLPQPEVYEED